jgi:hypothetical protein
VNDTRPSLLTLVGTGALIAVAVIALALRPIVTGGAGAAVGPDVTRPPDAFILVDPDAARTDADYAVWGRTEDGHPLRWDACRPIDLVLSVPDAPPGAEQDVREAAAHIASASGLQLRLLGISDERPSALRPLVVREQRGWRWNPVLIAWMTPEEARAAGIPLEMQDRGVALPVTVRADDREGYVTGQVVLNAARGDLRPGFVDRSDAWGATLLHELGHLIGLAHVEDTGQLMSLDPGRGPVVLGDGDLAGLELLGATAGCTRVPEANIGLGLRPPLLRAP